MFPGPTELLLIGCSIESIWTPKSKFNILTPKTNSQTSQPKGKSHVMSGTIFCACLTFAISVLWSVLKWCRKEHKKNQVKKESQRSQDQWWVWLREAAKGLHQLYHLLHHEARENQTRKSKVLWVRKLRCTIEQGDPLFAQKERPVLRKSKHVLFVKKLWNTIERGNLLFAVTPVTSATDSMKKHTHQATQNGILIKLGLLKSEILVKCWKQERCLRSTRSASTFPHWKRRNRIRIVVRIQIIRKQDEWSGAKKTKRSSMNVTEDGEKHSVRWGMFMSSTLQSSVFMGKNYSDTWHSIKNSKDLTMKQMFDISEKLYPNNQMRSMEWRQLIEEEVISIQRKKSLRIFRFCIVSG